MEEEKQVKKYGISQEDLLDVLGKYPGFRREEFKKRSDDIKNAPQLIREDGSKGMLLITRSYEGTGSMTGGPLQLIEEIQIDFPGLDIGSFYIKTRLARLVSPVFNTEQGHYVIDGISTNPLANYEREERHQIPVRVHKRFEKIAKQYGLRCQHRSGVLLSEKMDEIPFGQVKGKLEKTLDNMLAASKAIKQEADEYVAHV